MHVRKTSILVPLVAAAAASIAWAASSDTGSARERVSPTSRTVFNPFLRQRVPVRPAAETPAPALQVDRVVPSVFGSPTGNPFGTLPGSSSQTQPRTVVPGGDIDDGGRVNLPDFTRPPLSPFRRPPLGPFRPIVPD